MRWIRQLLRKERQDDAYERFVNEYESPKHSFWLSKGFMVGTAVLILVVWLLGVLRQVF